MEIPVIYIFTHDSIGVGEDGPTHQPIEQLVSLRAIPNLITLRPGDANELVEAWRVIMQLRHKPAVLILSRQPLPTLDRTRYAPASGVAKGGYILADAPGGKPEILFLATGSEVGLASEVYEKLTAEGVRARLVSLPSWELFEQQPQEYRDSVIPPEVTARISVELGSTMGWAHYHGSSGCAIGMKTFGASAPLKELQKKFGVTPENLLIAARELLSGKQ
jgi:transketolase